MAPRPRSPSKDSVAPTLSIGALSEATGIGVETLRAWERRYGRPRPRRLPSGHRRYEPGDVAGLRLAAEAVARGRRPSEVLALGPSALERLLGALGSSPGTREGEDLTDLLALVRAFRGAGLRAALFQRARRLGPRDFVTRVAEPFGVLVGRRWASGALAIRHEHFATETVSEVLGELRSRLRRPRAGAPLLLFTTLPGERHGVGCAVAALLARVRGARAQVLGADTPVEEIASAAMEAGACGVGVSVSLATGGVATDRRLSELRRRLPPSVSLVVGGRGARGPRKRLGGMTFATDPAEFEAWLDDRLLSSPTP